MHNHPTGEVSCKVGRVWLAIEADYKPATLNLTIDLLTSKYSNGSIQIEHVRCNYAQHITQSTQRGSKQGCGSTGESVHYYGTNQR